MPDPQYTGGTYYVIKAPNGDIFVLSTNDLKPYQVNSVDDLPQKLNVPGQYAGYTNALKSAVGSANGLLLADVTIVPPSANVFGVSATLVQSNYLPDDPDQASQGGATDTLPKA